jgi:hypothetical protein
MGGNGTVGQRLRRKTILEQERGNPNKEINTRPQTHKQTNKQINKNRNALVFN